jgi:hypothetical protein
MRLFWRLCHISFWIVLAVIALGIFESVYLDGARTAFIGCRWGDLGLECAEGPLKGVKEVLLNLPVLFLVALLMPLEGPVWAVLLKLLLETSWSCSRSCTLGERSSDGQGGREGEMTPGRPDRLLGMR